MTLPKSVWANFAGLTVFTTLVSLLVSYFVGDVIFSLAGHQALPSALSGIRFMSRATGACLSMLILWGGLLIPAELMGIVRLYKRGADYSSAASAAVRSGMLALVAVVSWAGVVFAVLLFKMVVPTLAS